MSKLPMPMSLETERDGRALAIQLLEELETEGAEERCSIDPQFWPDGAAAQEIPLLRYLQILRERNSPEVDRGFCAVITDFAVMSINIGRSGFYTQFLDASQPAKGLHRAGARIPRKER